MRKGSRTVPIIDGRKQCTKCKAWKPLSEFFTRRQNQFHSACKRCELDHNNAYAKSPAGKAARIAWKKSNPKKAEAYRKRHSAYLRKMRRLDPDKFRNQDLKKIGITLQEKMDQLNQQDNCCAICGSKTPNIKNTWFADHDHKTGKFRGVLCGKCNAVLGYANDSPKILSAAIQYLNKKDNHVN